MALGIRMLNVYFVTRLHAHSNEQKAPYCVKFISHFDWFLPRDHDLFLLVEDRPIIDVTKIFHVSLLRKRDRFHVALEHRRHIFSLMSPKE